MDFQNLPEKQILNPGDDCSTIVLQKKSGKELSFRSSLDVLESFYINANILDQMSDGIRRCRKSLDSLVSKINIRDDVDSKFLQKKDSNYQKSKLLTEDRLLSLLSEYCTEDKVKIDIQNCKEHSRSVANNLANHLASVAATSRSTNSINASNTTNTAAVIDAMQNDSGGGD